MKVFLVNHHFSKQCGVYGHGARVAKILLPSTRHEYHNIEANDPHEMNMAIETHGKPDVIVFNFHPATQGWAEGWERSKPRGIVTVGTIHEGNHPSLFDGRIPTTFQQWIWHDPSLELIRDLPVNVHWTPRPLPVFTGERLPYGQPLFSSEQLHPSGDFRIGTCCFAFGGKGFEEAIAYARAIGYRLRIHAPEAFFGGSPGVENPYIESFKADDVEVSTDFKTEDELVNWLVGNDMNALFYPYNWGRGISSAADFLVAAGRPMVLSSSNQFRHIHQASGKWPAKEVDIYDPLPLQKLWSAEVFRARHDDIMDKVAR